MSQGRHAVILTVSANHAIRAEHVLSRAGLETKLIPVPRHLSSDCGVCVKICAEDTPQAKTILQENRVPYDEIVPM